MRKAEGVVFFQTGCMALALWPREELAKDAAVGGKRSGFPGSRSPTTRGAAPRWMR
jgi:hypothetical protein